MTFSVEEVTPEQAAAWLDKNHAGNRKPKSNRIDQWSRDMREGRWRLSHQGIAFDVNGTLIDGQNRLAAVVRSSAAVPMLVVRGCPSEVFEVTDSGVSRTSGDVLHSIGLRNANRTGAVARGVLRYDVFPHRVWVSTADVSKAQVVQFAEGHADLLGIAVDRGRAVRAQLPNVNATAYSVLAFLILREGGQVAFEEFHEGVLTGAMLELGDPRLVLRNQLFSTTWGGIQSQLMAYINAWNAWVEGRELRQLKAYRSSLPMPKVAVPR